MRTAEAVTETDQLHHLLDNLAVHLAKGKEWATPGVQLALQRVVAGLDTGIETASPRLQAVLRRLADELAGGMGTFTPRVQERLKRVGPKPDVLPPEPVRNASRTPWVVGGLLALVAVGVILWRMTQMREGEPAPAIQEQEPLSVDAGTDPDLTPGRM